jgi:hypothetical protein
VLTPSPAQATDIKNMTFFADVTKHIIVYPSVVRKIFMPRRILVLMKADNGYASRRPRVCAAEYTADAVGPY